MIKMFSKRTKNQKGFTLVELIVVIAILGILAGIAVPRLSGFRESAVDRANQANAKLMTNVAQVVQADTGKYPTAEEWSFVDKKLTVTQATFSTKVYIQEDIVLQDGGKYTGFSYDPSTGTVSLTPTN